MRMQNIVRLDEYRRRKGVRNGPPVPDAPRWFCLACDTDRFKLYASGTVHCASCGALIRNVQIWAPPER